MSLQYSISNQVYMKNVYLFDKLLGINKYIEYKLCKKKLDIDFKLENDYILINENGMKAKILFSSFIKMAENEEYIYILTNFNNSIIVPKKVFRDLSELNKFKKKIQKYIDSNKEKFDFNINNFLYTIENFTKLIGYVLPIIIALILTLIELSIRKSFNFTSIENVCALIASILIISSIFSAIFYFILYNYIKKIKKFNKDIECFNIETYGDELKLFNKSMSIEVSKSAIRKIKKDKICLSINIKSYSINNVFLEKTYIDECKKLLSKNKYFNKKIKTYKIPCKNLLIESVVMAILPIIFIAALGIVFYIFTWICYLLL